MTDKTDKPKKKFTPEQIEMFRKNAAKARKVLAMKRKKGIPLGKQKPDSAAVEIPLAAIPARVPAAPVAGKMAVRNNKTGRIDRESVDALAQLTVAVWQEFMRRRG